MRRDGRASVGSLVRILVAFVSRVFRHFRGFLTALREGFRAIFQVARLARPPNQGVSAPPGQNRPGSRSAETESRRARNFGSISGPLAWREIPSLLTVKLAFLFGPQEAKNPWFGAGRAAKRPQIPLFETSEKPKFPRKPFVAEGRTK